METISLASINGHRYFTSGVPDVTIAGTDGVSQLVTITCGGQQLLQETMWPVNNVITLKDLGELLEPYARQSLVCTVGITAGSTTSTFTVLFAMVDVGITAQEFYDGYFLSILMGTRVTAAGRRELLWYYGQESAEVEADYSDGTSGTFTPQVVGGTSAYTCLDVSPNHFERQDKVLIGFTVTAGSRTQRYDMDLSAPDCAPILEFYNSFGVWEYLYCTGTHEVAPDFKRSSARIDGMLRNYKIEETRIFKADTGILTTAMAQWAEEVFRADEVYVVNVINGSVTSADGGKEVVITDSKSENKNDLDYMPRFTFN